MNSPVEELVHGFFPEGDIQIIATEIIHLDSLWKEAVSKTAIRIPLPALDETQISQLKSLLAKHSGTCPLEFELLEQQCRIRVIPEEDLSVDPIPSFVEAVEDLFGENSVALYTGK